MFPLSASTSEMMFFLNLAFFLFLCSSFFSKGLDLVNGIVIKVHVIRENSGKKMDLSNYELPSLGTVCTELNPHSFGLTLWECFLFLRKHPFTMYTLSLGFHLLFYVSIFWCTLCSKCCKITGTFVTRVVQMRELSTHTLSLTYQPFEHQTILLFLFTCLWVWVILHI